ncbi:hypothetical protein P8452_19446 [Trifolium repens]|nr:hypothetical protein P8452_19446 [Trifolium repens]
MNAGVHATSYMFTSKLLIPNYIFKCWKMRWNLDCLISALMVSSTLLCKHEIWISVARCDTRLEETSFT